MVIVAMVGIAVLIGALVLLTMLIEAPVIRTQVESFARTERLVLTQANVGLVMRYLGTTRRWRAFGLIAGLFLGAGVGLSRGGVNVDLGGALLGWFVGAVVAEWRVGLAPGGGTSRAVLTPRLARSYAGLGAGIATGTAAASVGGLAVLDVVTGQSAARRVAAVVVLVSAVAVCAAGGAVQRQVLARPQPAGLDPSVIDADDAIRQASLCVVAGSVTALLGGFAAALVVLSPIADSLVPLVALLVIAAGAGVGFVVSVSRPVLPHQGARPPAAEVVPT